jgi:hypothetical protein
LPLDCLYFILYLFFGHCCKQANHYTFVQTHNLPHWM